jgi:hypothetical protein
MYAHAALKTSKEYRQNGSTPSFDEKGSRLLASRKAILLCDACEVVVMIINPPITVESLLLYFVPCVISLVVIRVMWLLALC